MSIMMIACFMPSMAFAGGNQQTITFHETANGESTGTLTVQYGDTVTVTIKINNEEITTGNVEKFGDLNVAIGSTSDKINAKINADKKLEIKANALTESESPVAVKVTAATKEGELGLQAGEATLNVTVAPKTLTNINTDGVTVTKVYNGEKTAGKVNGEIGFTGKVNDDNVSITAVASDYEEADKYVGENKTVTLTFSLAGEKRDNYVIAGDSKTVEYTKAAITPATQTITGSPAALKVNNKLDLSKTFTSNAKDAKLTFTLDPSSETDVVKLEGTTLTGLKAGTATIKVTAAAVDVNKDGKNEYEALANGTVTVNVTPKDTIEADNITFAAKQIIYGEAYTQKAPTLTAGAGEEGGDWSYTYKGKDGTTTTYEESTTPPTNAGTYTVTAKYESENKVGTATADLTIAKKDLHITGVKVADKVYDGTDVAKIEGTPILNPADIVAGDADKLELVTTDATATFAEKNAVANQEVTFDGYTLSGEKAANYELQQPTGVRAAINKAPLRIKTATVAEKTYDGKTTATVNEVTFDGLVTVGEKTETLTATTDYTVDAYFFAGPDVGTDKDVIVEVTLKDDGNVAKNYVLDGDAIDAKGNIKKATKTSNLTAEVTVQKETYGFVDIHSAIETDGDIGKISVPEGKDEFFTTDGKPSVNARDLLEFTLSETASDSVEITVPVENARNYENYNIKVTVTVSDTEQVNVSAPRALDRVYDGTMKPLVEAGVLSSEKYKLQYAVDDGEFGFDIPTAKDVNVKDNGDTKAYTVKYKVVSVAETGDVTDKKTEFDPVEVRIEKKEVTYAPENITLTEGSALPTPVLKWDGVISSEEPLEAQLKAFAEKATFKFVNDEGVELKDSAAPGKYRIVCTNTSEFAYTDHNYDVYDDEGILTINKNSGSSGGSYYPYTPSTPSTPAAPGLDKTKTDSTTALNAAATANKYDAAEQAEVKKILDKANADIKNAKTEAEVKAIEEAAQAEIDKILTTEEKAIVAALDNVEKRDFATKSKVITRKGGKKVIRLTWTAPDGVDVDGYEIFRSTKKNSGFGKKPYFTTSNTSYTNTKDLKTGKTYYYKVRAFVVINGERVYTDYSLKANRKL